MKCKSLSFKVYYLYFYTMNRYKTGSVLWFSLGIILCTVYLNQLFSSQQKEVSSDHANLAIRQVADHLYKLEADFTTTIPPVVQTQPGTYQVQLNRAFDYGELPKAIEKAFDDYGIQQAYTVLVESCESDTVLLGFNILALQRNEIPCLGREQVADCAKLKVVFEKGMVKQSNSILILGLLSAGIGVLGLFFSAPKTRKSTIIIPTEKEPNQYLQIGDTLFDPKNLKIDVQGEEQSLTYRESKLLEYLSKHPNEVLKREDILDNVWHDEGTIVGRSLDVFISRLRKILKNDSRIAIKNVHGVGYRLEITAT